MDTTDHKATIYTKRGDKGETGLPGKRRLPKKDQLFEVLGNFDQTNASLGVVLSLLVDGDGKLANWLVKLQRVFFELGACLANEHPFEEPILKRLPKLVEEMEEQIDHWDTELPKLQNFILPGGCPAGASLHLSRTLARQTERAYHRLDESFKPEEISVFINRLSDFLFEAARYTNFREKQPETIWTKEA